MVMNLGDELCMVSLVQMCPRISISTLCSCDSYSLMITSKCSLFSNILKSVTDELSSITVH